MSSHEHGIQEIFLYLEAQDLEVVQWVCKSWKKCSKNNRVWWPMVRRHLMQMANTWEGNLFRSVEGETESLGCIVSYEMAKDHFQGLIRALDADWLRWGSKVSWQDQFYQLQLRDANLLWVDVTDGTVFILPRTVVRCKPGAVSRAGDGHSWLRKQVVSAVEYARTPPDHDHKSTEEAYEFVFHHMTNWFKRIRLGHSFCIHIGSEDEYTKLFQGHKSVLATHPRRRCDHRASSFTSRSDEKEMQMTLSIEHGSMVKHSTLGISTFHRDVDLLMEIRRMEIDLQRLILSRTSFCRRPVIWVLPCSYEDERDSDISCPAIGGGTPLPVAPWRCGMSQRGFNLHSITGADTIKIDRHGCGSYMGPGCISPHHAYMVTRCKHWQELDYLLCDSCFLILEKTQCKQCILSPVLERPCSHKRLRLTCTT